VVDLRLHGEKAGEHGPSETEGLGGKLEGVPRCWRRGGAHRGNRRGISSTTTIEQTTNHGGDPRARAQSEGVWLRVQLSEGNE
jgi:hypothetical protein